MGRGITRALRQSAYIASCGQNIEGSQNEERIMWRAVLVVNFGSVGKQLVYQICNEQLQPFQRHEGVQKLYFINRSRDCDLAHFEWQAITASYRLAVVYMFTNYEVPSTTYSKIIERSQIISTAQVIRNTPSLGLSYGLRPTDVFFASKSM